MTTIVDATKAVNTLAMISAAQVMTRAVLANPVATALEVSLPAPTPRCTRASRKTS